MCEASACTRYWLLAPACVFSQTVCCTFSWQASAAPSPFCPLMCVRHPYALGVLLVWLLLGIGSLYFAWQFLLNTDPQFSPVGDLQNHINDGTNPFARDLNNAPLFVLITAVEAQSIRSESVRHFSTHLAAKLAEFEDGKGVVAMMVWGWGHIAVECAPGCTS